MLTKQHFEAIARIIKDRIEHIGTEQSLKDIEFLSYDLADYFAQCNEHFGHIRFLTACGFKA